VNKAAQGSANMLEAEGSKFGGRTLPWSRSSSIRRFILHAQSGITPTFAALARSGVGLVGSGRIGQHVQRDSRQKSDFRLFSLV
jgi:hypothetical protein